MAQQEAVDHILSLTNVETNSSSASVGWIRVCAYATLLAIGLAGTAHATPLEVAVDTTGLSGLSGKLAFDFVGFGTPPNTMQISGFTTNGTLGQRVTTGKVSGTLPGLVALDDSNSLFNEYLTSFTFDTTLSFVIDGTSFAPLAGTPDEFSFFLLDQTGTTSLVTTSDPTGANALFIWDFTGTPGGALTIFTGNRFSVTAGPVESTVPEPTAALLVGTGLIGLARRSWAGNSRTSRTSPR
jgi:hypothetical protein